MIRTFLFVKNDYNVHDYLTKQISSVSLFHIFSMSLQLSYGDTYQIDGLVQQRHNSIANARLSCTEPSKYECDHKDQRGN